MSDFSNSHRYLSSSILIQKLQTVQQATPCSVITTATTTHERAMPQVIAEPFKTSIDVTSQTPIEEVPTEYFAKKSQESKDKAVVEKRWVMD